MSKLLPFARKVQTQISKTSLNQAQKLLQKLEANNPGEERLLSHLYAKIAIQRGAETHGLKTLIEVSKKYDPHIGVLIDICECYYLKGDVFNWRIWSHNLDTEFQVARKSLSAESRLRAVLSLGKYFENDARINRAIELYRSELLMAATGDRSRKDLEEKLLQLLQLSSVSSSS